jgi:exosome complex RNA-binding protein Csl4
MATVQRVDDSRAAGSLADVLNGDARKRPVVVVTIPSARDEPWIDVEEIAREAGELAEVYLMPTSDISWDFSHRMPEGTQVYGGAGRVYPVGHEWLTNLHRSPLRFAWNEQDGERATQQLVSDMFRMAAAAGLLQSKPKQHLREVDAEVAVIVAGRALVEVGNRFPATIAEELTVEDVPIDRLLAVGQHVRGWYDPDTNRVDVTRSLVAPTAALAAYAVGDVVLAKVSAIRDESAQLMLYPRTTVPAVTATVHADDVTSNPLDDLDLLMTVGEVVTARVTSTGPWSLTLTDIDDDEVVVPSPALLAGGPPWLVPDADEPRSSEQVDAAPAQMAPQADPEPRVITPPRPPRPVPRPGPHAPAPPAVTAPSVAAAGGQSSSTTALLLQIDGLKADVNQLRRTVDAGAAEREQLRFLYNQAERRANRAENELRSVKARLRKAGNAKTSAATDDGPEFADREQGFRYLVLTQWAKRTILSEQVSRPLPDYLIGPRFLDSLAELEGVKVEKVADVVFEVVTGRAPQIAGREVHRLRAGAGGEDQVRVRADRAVAWRASLQVKTASARRLHYWELPDGRFELARVTVHDDYDI